MKLVFDAGATTLESPYHIMPLSDWIEEVDLEEHS